MVSSAEQARKEELDRENASNAAEGRRTELVRKVAEQLRQLAKNLELRPAETLQDIAAWQKEQEATIAKANDEVKTCRAEEKLAREKAEEQGRVLEDSLPQMERNLEQAQEA